MTIYEIEQAIMDCIDLETGEIVDIERLNNLEMERDTKIENVALWHKELLAEAEAIKAEKMKLAERQRVAENKAESLKNYLDVVLAGGKFKTARVAISYRKSEALDIAEDAIIPDEFFKVKREPMKTELKEAIKKGDSFYGVGLIEKQNIQIK